jgi:hypothetical protein
VFRSKSIGFEEEKMEPTPILLKDRLGDQRREE